MSTILQGWPDDKNQVPQPLQAYWNYRDELAVQNDLIYKGAQVMIPHSMQAEMLHKIHANHFGPESNIRMAREVLFWPGMRQAIFDMCNSCGTCAQYVRLKGNERTHEVPPDSNTTVADHKPRHIYASTASLPRHRLPLL